MKIRLLIGALSSLALLSTNLWSGVSAAEAETETQFVEHIAMLHPNVEILTTENFDEKLVPGETWIVMFFAPWCEYAAAFYPELDEVKDKLEENGYDVKVGSVDVSLNLDLGKKYQIQVSPTTKVFQYKDGEWHTTDY